MKFMVLFSRKKKNLLTEWNSIEQFLKDKKILLFLDYDGTLTPIVDSPQKTVFSSDVKNLLDTLTKHQELKVSIVSGRAMDDLKNQIGLKNLTYVGNHGFEISGPNIHFENTFFPNSRKIFLKIIDELQKKLNGLNGVVIEDKGVTLSVHYRLLEEKRKQWFDRKFLEVVKKYSRSKEIKVFKGKKVHEIRPPVDWDKGKAVLWLIKEYNLIFEKNNTIPIYIGDDQTDEDAFKIIKDGLTVKVGDSKKTLAEYHLNDVDDVVTILRKILNLKKQK